MIKSRRKRRISVVEQSRECEIQNYTTVGTAWISMGDLGRRLTHRNELLRVFAKGDCIRGTAHDTPVARILAFGPILPDGGASLLPRRSVRNPLKGISRHQPDVERTTLVPFNESVGNVGSVESPLLDQTASDP
jgi:hypothetical protein